MANRNKSQMAKILSGICLILSVLLLTTFFMPIYTIRQTEKSTSFNAVVLIQAMNLTDEEAAKLTLEILKPNIAESKRDSYSAQLAAYLLFKSKYADSFKASAIFAIAVLVASVAGIIVSFISLIKNKLGITAIITNLIIVAISITFFILVVQSIKNLSSSTQSMNWGASSWIALISSVSLLSCAVTEKQLSKKRNK